MIRIIKIVLLAAVAAWGLAGGLANLAGYESGIKTVSSVVSMETLPPGAGPESPEPPNPTLVTLGYGFIWSFKLIGGALALIGAVLMWRRRRADVDTFRQAKKWGIAGCAVMFFMLFVGFSLIAIGPFKLYLSPMISAVYQAAAFATQIGLVMVFLAQEDH